MFDEADANHALMLGRVTEFQRAFDGSKDRELAHKIILEEAKELVEAYEHVVKEAADLLYTLAYYEVTQGEPDDIEDYTLDLAVEIACDVGFNLGNDMMVAFKRVHESNMSKLGDDGKPVRREDGKILKGPNYKPPVLSDLVRSAFA